MAINWRKRQIILGVFPTKFPRPMPRYFGRYIVTSCWLYDKGLGTRRVAKVRAMDSERFFSGRPITYMKKRMIPPGILSCQQMTRRFNFLRIFSKMIRKLNSPFLLFGLGS